MSKKLITLCCTLLLSALSVTSVDAQSVITYLSADRSITYIRNNVSFDLISPPPNFVRAEDESGFGQFDAVFEADAFQSFPGSGRVDFGRIVEQNSNLSFNSLTGSVFVNNAFEAGIEDFGASRFNVLFNLSEPAEYSLDVDVGSGLFDYFFGVSGPNLDIQEFGPLGSNFTRSGVLEAGDYEVLIAADAAFGGSGVLSFDFQINTVPEPSAYLAFAFATVCFAGRRRRAN